MTRFCEGTRDFTIVWPNEIIRDNEKFFYNDENEERTFERLKVKIDKPKVDLDDFEL